MKFKSEKGFTLIDITVALIVVLAFMSLISVLFFNLTKSSKSIERESDATFIATSVIEDVKAQDYFNIALTNNSIISDNNISSENGLNVVKVGSNEQYKYLDGSTVKVSIPDGYTCILTVQNYVPRDKIEANPNYAETDLVKLVSAEVMYRVGGETKSVQIKTSIVNDNN
ncbi:MAG: type II secretion system protein [Clostridia bacterium]|nr:type II secretion system protein [Clostridia bacterium]